MAGECDRRPRFRNAMEERRYRHRLRPKPGLVEPTALVLSSLALAVNTAGAAATSRPPNVSSWLH